MVKRLLRICIAVVVCIVMVGSMASVLAKTATGPDINDVNGGGGLEDSTTIETTTSPTTTTTVVITTEDEAEEEEEEDEDEDEHDDEEEEETTEEDNSFKVYLQLNGGKMENGKTFLTHDMPAPGLVPVPEEPTKAGYLFDGWYSDEGFTKEWNFVSNFAMEEMTIYAKWIRDPAAILYDITVEAGKGGKITVRPERAAAGETVLIMIQPEEGMRLKKGSLFINGEPSDILSFEMPAGPVVVEAEFELTPVEAEKADYSIVIVAVGAGLALIILIVIIVVNKRRNAIIVPEFDEDGALIIDDDEDVWIDETIVVESGFLGGRKASDINPPNIEDFDGTIPADKLDE